MKQNDDFKLVITSEHKLFDLHLKEVIEYKDLIKLFIKRDFTALYKQTILGPAWAIIQPLFTTIVFSIIFGDLAHLSTADTSDNYIIPAFLFYMAGNICWSYFSGALHTIGDTFNNNAHIMGKVYYPRLVTPIAVALSKTISFAIQFVLFVVVWLFYLIKGGTSLSITPALLLLPLTVIQIIVLALGCGIIISSFTTKYKDLNFAITFCLQLWQYATPIAYGLSLVPDKYILLYMLNPVTPIITTFRYAMFGFGYFNLTFYLISWAITLFLFFIGVVLFSKVERTFADTI